MTRSALSLDDPRWADLGDAYGSAADIPAAIRRLADGDLDATELLWGHLCHQGTVTHAAYAALPHLVAIAAQLPRDEQIDFWGFAGTVALASRTFHVPEVLEDGLRDAIERANELTLACFSPGLSELDAGWLLVAVAGFRGHSAIASALERVGGRTFYVDCSRCGKELLLSFEKVPYTATQETAQREGPQRFSIVELRPAREELASLAELARSVGHHVLAERIVGLDGAVHCPSCGRTFELFQTFLDEESW